jgi:hypothetical protein
MSGKSLKQKFVNVPETQTEKASGLSIRPAQPSTAMFFNLQNKVPQVIIGEDESTNDIWKSVLYPVDKRFSETPTLLIRASSVDKKFININIPALTIPQPRPIDIFGSDVEWGKECRDICYQKAVESFGDWGAFNWARNAISGAFATVGWGIGGIFGFLYNSILLPQFNAFEDKINISVLQAYQMVEDKALEIKQIFNQYVDTLHEMWKLPSGAVPVVVEIRNETKFGFQWKPQASGQKVSFLAYGPRA